MFGRTNQRRDVRPFLVRQIARITQLVTIVFGAVLACPHRRPLLNQAANLESHPIHPIQLLSGRTLSRTKTAFEPPVPGDINKLLTVTLMSQTIGDLCVQFLRVKSQVILFGGYDEIADVGRGDDHRRRINTSRQLRKWPARL